MRSGVLSIPIVLILAGCAQGVPPAEPSRVSVSPPPAESAETQGPEREKSDVPDAPWQVSYLDGSGNAFRFESSDARATYTYSPMTPERSSSGTYSGGEPVSGTLAEDRIAELWKRLLELENATGEHTEERAMGTGAFTIVTPAGERSFLVKRGDALQAFDALLASLRAP